MTTPDPEGHCRASGALVLALCLFASVAAAQPADDLSTTTPAASARIALRWKAVPQAVEYELEIARDDAFVNVVLRERVKLPGYRWKELPTATHHWRVRSIDSQGRRGDWSETRTVSASIAPPSPLAPQNGAALATTTTAPELRATASPLFTAYLFELSRDPNFADAPTPQRSATPVLHLNPLAPGEYWWRVSGIDVAGRRSAPSAAWSFKLGADPLPTQPAPDAIFAGTERPPTVTLAWSAPPTLRAFRVELQPESGPARPFDVRARELAFTPETPGRYVWRVRALEPDTAPWSAPRAFTVNLGGPRLESPAPGAEVVARRENVELTFTWQPVPGATRYRVELSRDDAFASLAAAQKLDGTRWRAVHVLPGNYRWRVTAYDRNERLHAVSEVRAIRVHPGPPLAAPRLTEPAAGAVLPDALPSLTLKWTAVPEADRFELAIAPPGELDDVAPTEAPSPTLTLPSPPSGDRAWRVRAVDAAGNAGPWSPTGRFFIGRPPTVRAELQLGAASLVADGRDSMALQVRLLDAGGRPVRGAALEIRSSAGQVQDIAELPGDAGSYRARYVAPAGVPDGRAAFLIVKDRAFEASTTVPLVEGTRLAAGVRAGWTSNFASVSAPVIGVDLTARTALLQGQLLIGVRGGYHATQTSLPILEDEVSSARADIAELAVLLLYALDRGPYTLYGGGGTTLQLALLSVAGTHDTAVVPGVAAALGLSRALGRGELSVEASYTLANLDTSIARLGTGGLAITLGYRFLLP